MVSGSVERKQKGSLGAQLDPPETPGALAACSKADWPLGPQECGQWIPLGFESGKLVLIWFWTAMSWVGKVLEMTQPWTAWGPSWLPGEGSKQAWLCLGSIGQSREVGGTEITGGRKTLWAYRGRCMKTPFLSVPHTSENWLELLQRQLRGLRIEHWLWSQTWPRFKSRLSHWTNGWPWAGHSSLCLGSLNSKRNSHSIYPTGL